VGATERLVLFPTWLLLDLLGVVMLSTFGHVEYLWSWWAPLGTNNYFYKMGKENLNKLAEDISNQWSMKEMWSKIHSLKLYKQNKPSKRATINSKHRDFLSQIATAPNTAMWSELSFSGDLLFRDSNSNLSAREHLDFLNSRNPHSAKGLDNVSYTTFYI